MQATASTPKSSRRGRRPGPCGPAAPWTKPAAASAGRGMRRRLPASTSQRASSQLRSPSSSSAAISVLARDVGVDGVELGQGLAGLEGAVVQLRADVLGERDDHALALPGEPLRELLQREARLLLDLL